MPPYFQELVVPPPSTVAENFEIEKIDISNSFEKFIVPTEYEGDVTLLVPRFAYDFCPSEFLPEAEEEKTTTGNAAFKTFRDISNSLDDLGVTNFISNNEDAFSLTLKVFLVHGKKLTTISLTQKPDVVKTILNELKKFFDTRLISVEDNKVLNVSIDNANVTEVRRLANEALSRLTSDGLQNDTIVESTVLVPEPPAPKSEADYEVKFCKETKQTLKTIRLLKPPKVHKESPIIKDFNRFELIANEYNQKKKVGRPRKDEQREPELKVRKRPGRKPKAETELVKQIELDLDQLFGNRSLTVSKIQTTTKKNGKAPSVKEKILESMQAKKVSFIPKTAEEYKAVLNNIKSAGENKVVINSKTTEKKFDPNNNPNEKYETINLSSGDEVEDCDPLAVSAADIMEDKSSSGFLDSPDESESAIFGFEDSPDKPKSAVSGFEDSPDKPKSPDRSESSSFTTTTSSGNYEETGFYSSEDEEREPDSSPEKGQIVQPKTILMTKKKVKVEKRKSDDLSKDNKVEKPSKKKKKVVTTGPNLSMNPALANLPNKDTYVKKINGLWTCQYEDCRKEYVLRQRHREHMPRNHFSEILKTYEGIGADLKTCTTCDQKWDQKGGLLYHIFYTHTGAAFSG